MTSSTTAKVVCGLDASEHAPTVFACATALAQRLGVRLEVVRVDESAGSSGPPAEVLLDAMADGAVLGVVGSRGRGPLRAALLGSVSAELAEEAPCPVVVVPPGASLPPLGARPVVVCRLDGSADDRPALHAAAWIADELGGALDAVNVRGRLALDTRTEAMVLARELQQLGVAPAVRVEAGNPVEQLGQVVERHRAALIVVRWDGDVLVPGAVAGKLAARARVPVMIVPPRVRVEAPAVRAA